MTLVKDPNAELDYVVNWGAWLNGDTIASSTFVVVGDLVIASNSHDDTTATVWFSGGTVDAKYDVTNAITTAAGRADERMFSIKVERKRV